MKKNYFYLLFMAFVTMLSLSFASCGDKDDEVDTTPISLGAGGKKTITGADTISTSNRFVAYGKNNTVYGWHVGETTLMVNNKKSISISVYPLYYLYDDPVCEWGCSYDNVKKKQTQGTLSSKSTSEILAYDNAGGATLLSYLFKNGQLSFILAMVSTNHTSTLGSYLSERFLMLPIYEGDEEYFAGIDGLDLESANSYVYMDLYNTKYWEVAYIKADDKSTRSASYIEDMKKELKEKLIPFMSKE